MPANWFYQGFFVDFVPTKTSKHDVNLEEMVSAHGVLVMMKMMKPKNGVL